jgi:hypothetical protein
MFKDPKEPSRTKQPEDGTKEDLNLTNNDASLINNQPTQQPDAATMSDQAGYNAMDNMNQSALNGDEINPEYGDAADPTFETL